MTQEISTVRLYVLRVGYFMNLVLLGLDVWPAIIGHAGSWDPMKGIAYSFWAALSAVSALGLRYPVKMVPLLILQLVYKCIWLVAVALPQWAAVGSTGLAQAMMIGVAVDLVVIPWPHVLTRFLREPGDRWR